eukprot:gene29468-5811_t
MGVDEARRAHWVCQDLISKGVECGHNLEYYDLYLRRLLTLFAFRDLLGRLPIGPVELDAIADSSTDPERSIVKKFGWPITEQVPAEPVTVATDSRWSWDALLFHENTSGAPDAQDTHCFNQGKGEDSMPDERPSTFEAVLDRYASLNNATGTNKTTSHAYGPLYSALFGEMRDRGGERGTPVKSILEIGVFSGASVQAFADFFPKAAVVGLDITLDNVVFGRDDPRVTFVKGDGTNSRFAECLGVHFDIILDDASHLPEDQVATLDAFSPFLNPGGLFVIEDIAGGKDLPCLMENLEHVAGRHGLLRAQWFDLRSVKGQFDDIVAVFRRP